MIEFITNYPFYGRAYLKRKTHAFFFPVHKGERNAIAAQIPSIQFKWRIISLGEAKNSLRLIFFLLGITVNSFESVVAMIIRFKRLVIVAGGGASTLPPSYCKSNHLK